MALVPYDTRKRRRYNSNYTSIPEPMQIVPSYSRNMNLSGYGRSSRSYPNRSYRNSYNNKWSTLDGRTHPVYPRPEIKFIDTVNGTTATPIAIPNTGTSQVVLNSMIEGTTNGTRIGSQVAVKSVYYQFILNLGATVVPVVVRHILLWDRQPNAIAPSYASIFNIGTGSAVTSPLNLQNRNRFVVLADERIPLSPNGDQIVIRDGFRKINQKATYAENNAFPTSGALLLLFISNENTGAEQPTVTGTWRLRYIDC